MKTLFLWLALCCGANAQTLKWTVQIPFPNFGQTHWSSYLRRDALGGIAVGLDYNKSPASEYVGCQLLWLNAAGKTVRDEVFPASEGLRFPVVLSASPTPLFVRFQKDDGSILLRKYTKRGVNITHLDTALAAGEEPVLEFFDNARTDRTGFFVTMKSESGLIAIKRFNIR